MVTLPINVHLDRKKLATLVGLYTGTGTIRYRYVFTRTQSGSFCRAHHRDRPIDHATPSVNNRPHLRNSTVVRPSNIGCSSAQRIIQNEPRAAHFRPAF